MLINTNIAEDMNLLTSRISFWSILIVNIVKMYSKRTYDIMSLLWRLCRFHPK